jgi:hypothetical protein
MSAFEVMRRASLGVFGAVALACASAPGGAFALTRAVGGIHVDVAPLNRILLVHEQYAVRLTRSRNAPSKLTRIGQTQNRSLTRSVVEIFYLLISRYF